jgi:DNA-binding PucR family transcriptional regulator
VGSLALEPAGLRRSLLEADYACRMASRRPPGQPQHATYLQVGSHLLLLALLDEDVMRVFRQAVLQPLLDHDARSPVDLVETLRVFLGSGQHWASTASRLGIHVNTLRHRLRLVEQLTGRDLRSMADLTDLHLAISRD